MATEIKNGTGDGDYRAKVDAESNLHVRAIQRTEFAHALEDGHAWNLGTGFITLTGTNSTPLLYFKTTGDEDYEIDLYVLLTRVSTGGDGSQGLVEIHLNPIAGTLVTAGTAITASNMKVGLTSQPSATMKKGAYGDTDFSGADSVLRSLVGADNRLLLGILTDIPKGQSVGISYTAPTSNTSMDVECIVEIAEEIDS